MWSHYANNHSGFCLVFRTIDGKIKQKSDWKKTRLSYMTPKSFSPSMTFSLPDAFEIKDIIYANEPQCLDGFMCFPASVSNDKYTLDEIQEFQKQYNSTYLQKHSIWDYEEEARVVLSSGIPWLAGDRLSLSLQQRLSHYESTQLVGIVLETKMSQSQKQRIKEIISDKVDRWYTQAAEEKIISKFILFEEKLSETNREVIIEPMEIYDSGKPIDKSHKDFTRFYEEWKDGHALHFKGKGCSRVQIKD